MLRPTCLICAAFFALLPPEATASMTPAEHSYLHCTKEKARHGQDVDQCLDELGRQAWYPLNEGMCAVTAGILDDAFAQGQDLSYKLLFFNERCSRIGYPHFATDRARPPRPAGTTEAENPFGSLEEQQEALTYSDWSLFNDPEGEFSIEFPANWRLIAAREPATKVKIASPLDATCSVLIDAVSLDWRQKIDDMIDSMEEGGYKEALESQIGMVGILQVGRTALNNRPAFRAIYTFPYKALNYELQIIVYDTMTWVTIRIIKVSCSADEWTVKAHSRLFDMITASLVIHHGS